MEIKIKASVENISKVKEMLGQLAPLAEYGDIKVECTLLDNPIAEWLSGAKKTLAKYE